MKIMKCDCYNGLDAHCEDAILSAAEEIAAGNLIVYRQRQFMESVLIFSTRLQ